MKKLALYVCYLAILYLVFHLVVFGASAWANRNYDEAAFKRGECQRVYYCLNI